MRLRVVLLLTAAVCCLVAAPASASIRRLLAADATAAATLSSAAASILGTDNGPFGNNNGNNVNSPQFNGNANGPNAFISNEGLVEQPGLIEVSASSTVDVHTDLVRALLRISLTVYIDGCERTMSVDSASVNATADAADATARRCQPTPASLQSLRSSCTRDFRGKSDEVMQYCGGQSVRHLISYGLKLEPIYDYECGYPKMPMFGVEDQWSNWCYSENRKVIGYRVYEVLSFDVPVQQAGAVISGAIEKGAEILRITHVASEGALVLGELRATQRATVEAALEVRVIAQLIAKLNQAATMQFHDEDEHWNYMHDRHESSDMERDFNDDGFGKSPFDKDRFQQCVNQKMKDYQNSGNNNNNYNSFSTSPATPVAAAGNNNDNGNIGNSGTCSGLQITLRSILCNPLKDAGQLGVFEGIAAVAATNLGSQQDGQKNQQDDHGWASSQSYQSYASPIVVPVKVKCILIVDIQNAEQQAQKNMKHGNINQGSGGPGI